MKDVRKEVSDEIRAHLDLHTAWLVQGGMPLDEARREAKRRFGALAVTRPRLHRAAQHRVRLLRWRRWWDDVATSLAASLIPARRASTLDPIIALRDE